MPVTATSVPDVLRVSFMQRDTACEQSEIVCYVRYDPSGGGLELSYSHHIARTRPVPHGTWELEVIARQSLTPALISMIETGAMLELWSVFRFRTRMFPAEPNCNLASVQW